MENLVPPLLESLKIIGEKFTYIKRKKSKKRVDVRKVGETEWNGLVKIKINLCYKLHRS